ncbi:molybdopterin cofactor-binding domain-containing protein [Aurantiacibacter aquimixticola]|uniref:Xanthine dehydrogenase family protein molybdopterin-binding subunit n=1 Tax=Aurantiacibacter aquimixticola TaxID=1958945 RepID=A0A419RVK8_9SPHN|nr:molybdopterin cofactor-binding domain-containing protein [Aurantiacibacter aquimixticola]RJY09797.1 xanthine dehydrogenase family protein molybdopterin-binding subunit [Aurantiacibacter aquimixticola]
MNVSRRGLLAGAAVGGGIVIAWALMPRAFEEPLEPAPGEIAFDAWLKIASDGVVTVAVPQLEMGQGVTTLLPQIVAMELGADWRQVAVEPAPVSGAYANIPLAAQWHRLWRPLIPALADEPDDLLLRRWAQDNRFTATAGGTTLAAYEQACREAGASARAMLSMAAAERWDVPWEQCRAENGFIYHDGERASFGELALEAAAFDPPDPPPLRPDPPADTVPAIAAEAAEVRLIEWPRLDLPSKVDGSHIFAGDVRLPDMVFAAIRHGPHAKSELLDFDASLASGQRGIIQLVRSKRWLAAVAENWWAAEEALRKIAPRFAIDRPVDSAAIADALDEAVRRGAAQTIESRGTGDVDYDPNFALRYDIAPALHATLETTTATARFADGTLEMWLPTQTPEAARVAAARAVGIAPADVVLYPVGAGGSFDRRLDNQVAIEAAVIAQEVGRPVQLMWSRWQEHVASYPRAPVAALVGAELNQEGAIAAMRARIACPPTMREFGLRLFENMADWATVGEVGNEADPFAVEGFAQSYAIPDMAVQHVPVPLALPTARMRGGAHGYTCFIRESFVDEVALRNGREPLSYRIAMLGQDAPMVDLLQRAGRLAGWDGGAQGSGQGLACHRMDALGATGRIACVAEASAGEGGVRVRRLFAAVDIGRVVNRDIALQQIEGGMIFALGQALGGATGYMEGLPTVQRLGALTLPTLADAPEIVIELVESTNEPFDPGEIGVPAVAPAIANAFFSATGRRLRRLPLLSAPA